MKKINFIFGVHNHQPVGNFDFVFEMAMKKSYLPFLEVFEKFKNLKVAIHNSGSLLEWIEKNSPEYMDRVKKLVTAGRAEIISGGFYEPIFPLIPDKDRHGQIKMMNGYINRKFGCNPGGGWLTERVWEPYLAKTFAEAGLKYTIVDDTHFKSSGLKEKEMLGYFVTEEEGFRLNVFPINAKMRYFVPFRQPEESIDYLRSLATEEGNNLVVLADDGEKFGVWPETYEWVYGQKWLERFFTELEKNHEWINVTTFSEYMTAHKPISRMYIPTTSYDEMLEWCMPADTISEYDDFVGYLKDHNMYESASRFVKGGYFKNFLNKYPESNSMQKKMAYVSSKVNKICGVDASEREPLRLLYSGQCNCAYWHGVFGGLYLNHLRFANYTNLNKAERLADEIKYKGNPWLEHEIIDIDKDGNNEILINSNYYNVYLSPSKGGHIFELDYKSRDFNLLDTLSRRKEAYHTDLFKAREEDNGKHRSIHEIARQFDANIKKDLIYDSYRRLSLIDHFLGNDTFLEEFRRNKYTEGGDFIEKEYASSLEVTEDRIAVKLERTAEVFFAKFNVVKTVTVKKNNPVIDIEYKITNLSGSQLDTRFGVEFNFGMLGGDSPDRFYYSPGRDLKDTRMISVGEEKGVKIFGIIDKWLKVDINLESEEEFDFWRFPIETVSQAIGRLEKVYQSSATLLSWKLSFKPKESKVIKIKKKVLDVR
ncbi:MAG: hypothetical protein A2452_12695 [Candidatus Firestonebacteria bacterium RIFOXYC2_FULL_39_67]|nr:MAG: hypothetical protein A2536_12060 [Candidatus Firestonebacteria bacterium RIFOXYD2_FULL_39_29]OGF52830.1 MAG: hypothetical protein A2497_01010 [Candidatus Firestonebacteria bacterium RifOxyC12_full_39_7]OGF57422.1 MAG: hypothetical protein A2452_12695 [Candidatus Firestonebacteria bacterium RIFOXYC2_FULL_39_67]